MNARTFQCNTYDKVDQLLEQNIDDSFQPNLALIFSSIKDNLNDLCKIFSDRNIQIFGASSKGEFIIGEYQMESVAVMLLDIDKNDFMIEITDVDSENTYDKVRGVALRSKEVFNNPAFIISGSDTTVDIGQFILGLTGACGEETTIIGGNSSSDNLMGGIVFTNNHTSTKGFLALIINADSYEIIGEAISGWKPVGTSKTVTKCDGHWVYELDNKPALDFLIKYMGAEIDFDDEEDLYNKIGKIYPIQILQDDGTSVIIPPLFFNQEEKSFMLARPVEEGVKIKFSLPPDFEVIDSVVESSVRIKEEKLSEADAFIIFSCVGRLNCLGPMVNDEIKGLIETWNVPSIGFFTFGEFGKVKGGKSTFHGTTVSWLALKEK